MPAVIGIAFSAGCLSPPGDVVSPGAGEAASGTPVTGIGSIIENPSLYENRTVVVAGRITLECASGCWFNLDDGSGILFVDLNARNYAIPQKTGSRATVTGVVRAGTAGPVLLADRVEVDGRVYP